MRPALLPSRHRYLLFVVGALAVLFLRRPAAFLVPQFWAEDFVFLLDAERAGVATFWTPRAGYLQIIPRLIAWPASHLDPLLQPAFFLLGWLLVMAAVLGSCLSRRHDLPLKAWLAAMVLLVPHSGEVFFNPTNAQWVAALGILLTTLKNDPAQAREWLADLGFIFVAGLSGPFIIFAAPLFAVRFVLRKSRASGVLCAAAMVVAAVQMWFIVHSPPDREFIGPFTGLGLFANVCFRLPCNAFFGVLIPAVTDKWVAIALGLAVLGFIGFAAWRSEQHRAAMLWLGGFVLCLLAATTVRKRFDLWGYGDLANGDRYFFIPKVVLLWIAGIAFASARIRWIKWTTLALMLCSVATNAPRYKFAPYTDYHWYAKCNDIRAGRDVEIMINPGWKFKYRRGSLESAGQLW